MLELTAPLLRARTSTYHQVLCGGALLHDLTVGISNVACIPLVREVQQVCF